MNRQEFDQWSEFHCKAFPQVKEWLSRQNLEFLMDEWSLALDRTRIADAIACTRKMIRGDLDHPNSFELAMLPAVIAKNSPRRVLTESDVKGKTYDATRGEFV